MKPVRFLPLELLILKISLTFLWIRHYKGRAAGVLVQSNNGIPGGAINVRIRGTGSFRLERNLYIL
jgi:hypothetical protein